MTNNCVLQIYSTSQRHEIVTTFLFWMFNIINLQLTTSKASACHVLFLVLNFHTLVRCSFALINFTTFKLVLTIGKALQMVVNFIHFEGTETVLTYFLTERQ